MMKTELKANLIGSQSGLSLLNFFFGKRIYRNVRRDEISSISFFMKTILKDIGKGKYQITLSDENLISNFHISCGSSV